MRAHSGPCCCAFARLRLAGVRLTHGREFRPFRQQEDTAEALAWKESLCALLSHARARPFSHWVLLYIGLFFCTPSTSAPAMADITCSAFFFRLLSAGCPPARGRTDSSKQTPTEECTSTR